MISACAVSQDPPGGPPDFTAPTLLSVQPDSGSVNPGLRDRVAFQFDEVISERSGGGLDKLFALSPRPERIDVSWKRSRIEVRPSGGWRPETVYHLTLLPGIADLSNNRLQEQALVIFTTGGSIPDTRVSGTVLNWDAGRAAPGSLIEAVLAPDSLVYRMVADSVGDFDLTALPPGQYTLYAAVDDNNNRERDRREAFDSVSITLDSAYSDVFWAYVHDTAGPQLREATQLDSLTFSIDFNQKLNPGPADPSMLTVRAMPDSVEVPVEVAWLQAEYDSVHAEELEAARAVADSAARDSALVADTTVTTDTTVAADTTVTPVTRDRGPVSVNAIDSVAAVDSLASADSVVSDRITELLATRPVLVDRWVVRLISPMPPGARYLIEATVSNVNGAMAESRTLLIVPDTTETNQQ